MKNKHDYRDLIGIENEWKLKDGCLAITEQEAIQFALKLAKSLMPLPTLQEWRRAPVRFKKNYLAAW